jgi:hypothetical protein
MWSRVLGLAALAVGCGTLQARAQAVDFRARLPHAEVLVCEPLPVEITIRNNGMSPLQAGGSAGYALAFEVLDASGLLLRELPQSAVLVPEVIEPQAQVVFTNDLQALFPVARHATLSVRARLTVGSRSYMSDKLFVDLMPGSEITWVNAPAADGVLRRFSLRSLSRGKRDFLFLRVENPDGSLCYGAAELGRLVRMGEPRLEVDSRGNVHVLHLSAPNQFIHSVFSPEGGAIKRDVLTGDLSMVRMVDDGQGSFRIAGAGQVAPPRDPIVDPLPLRRGL